jgi:hypothetical protein
MKSRSDRFSDILFFTLLAGSIALTVVLAAVNQSPGSPDSQVNLEVARNLARGKGFVSGSVRQLFVREPLQHLETTRAPVVPYALAGLFTLFGISMALPVLLNGATVVLAALCLRTATASAAGRLAGNLAGTLLFLSGNYEMVSLWNNNALVLFSACMLLVAERQRTKSGWLLLAALFYSVVGALGFLTKATFILTAFSFAFVSLLLTPSARTDPPARRWFAFATFAAAFAVLTAPYWVRNLVLFGDPLYSVSAGSRLAERYGGLPFGVHWTLRFDHPLSVREMVAIHGALGLVTKEIRSWLQTAEGLVALNPAVFVSAALGATIYLRRRSWSSYALAAMLMSEPVFAAGFYWHYEARYLWPAYVGLLSICGTVLHDATRTGQAQLLDARRSRIKRIGVGLLLVALIWGAVDAARKWTAAFKIARQSEPAWVAAVRSTPPDAVVLTDLANPVVWYTERQAVNCPGGSRADLVTVLETYHPTHYLETGYARFGLAGAQFGKDELEPIALGESRGRQWAFYRLRKRW